MSLRQLYTVREERNYIYGSFKIYFHENFKKAFGETKKMLFCMAYFFLGKLIACLDEFHL